MLKMKQNSAWMFRFGDLAEVEKYENLVNQKKRVLCYNNMKKVRNK